MVSPTERELSLQQQNDQLEEDILTLEVEKFELQQKIRNFEFDHYKLQEIQRLAKAGTWELNHISYDLEISEELSQILCDDPSELCEISWHDFLNLLVANDDAFEKDLLIDVMQKGNSLDFEHQMNRPDGSTIYVHHHCKTFYNHIGQPLITVGMIRDVTVEHDQSIELEKRSETDELTQLFNRRRINALLREQFEVFRRYQKQSSYILIDIDFFKRFNDNYGHLIGDEVLRKAARTIKNNIRRIDYAGRWGGEEFLIICQNTSLENALLLAEKLRKSIMGMQISTGDEVTASFGVGEITQGENIDALLTRIDTALYDAKESGRNRVKASCFPLSSIMVKN